LIGRELTKIFEQIISGTAPEMCAYFEKNPDKVRGEFVVAVEAV
jgi:16S rRNA C1402 (ribose-2'-O) methylase RsmI